MRSTPGAVACGDFGKGSRGVLLPTEHPHTPTAKTLHPPEPEPSQRKCMEAQLAYTQRAAPPTQHVLVPVA